MHSSKIIFLVFEFLTLVFCVLFGRMIGIYEVLVSREPFSLVAEVNPGVSIMRIEEGSCDGVDGVVYGRKMRIWYGNQLVDIETDGRWSLVWDDT